MRSHLAYGLSIGNWEDAKNANGSTYIITVACDSPFIGQEHYSLVDGPGNKRETFYAAVASTVRHLRENKSVLVHCVGGRSRSGAVCVAALSILTGESIYTVYEKVLASHSDLRIHPALAEFL